MSFKVFNTDEGREPAIEYLPAAAITPIVGLALTETAGNLAIASGTTKPGYISMAESDAAVTAGTVIPVFRAHSTMIFETVNTAAFTSVNIGDKVTLSADGLGVTATTTGGVAEVVGFNDTAAGSRVLVRF